MLPLASEVVATVVTCSSHIPYSGAASAIPSWVWHRARRWRKGVHGGKIRNALEGTGAAVLCSRPPWAKGGTCL